MKIRIALITALLFGGMSNISQAAVITRTHNIFTTFNDGIAPVGNVQSFTLTFDPTVKTLDGLVSYYSSSSIFGSFNPSRVLFSSGFLASSIFPDGTYNLHFGGPDSAGGVKLGTDAFQTTLQINADGSLFRPFGVLGYAVAGDSKFFGSASSTIATVSSLTSVVPEPATWTMMLAGFALVGGAMRVRRRRVVMAV